MSTSRSSRSVVASLHPTRQQLDELDALLKRMLDLPGGPAEADLEELEEEPQAPPPPPPVRPRTRAVPPPVNPIADQEPPSLAPRVVAVPTSEPKRPAANPAVQPPHLYRTRLEKQQESLEEPTGQDEDWVPLRSSWQPSPQTWPPLAESWRQAREGHDDVLLRQDSPREPELPEPRLAETPPAPAFRAPTRLTVEEEVVLPSQHQEPLPQSELETHIYPRPFVNAIDPISKTIPSVPAPLATVGVQEGAAETTSPDPLMVRPLLWLNQGFDALVGWAGPPGRWLVSTTGRNFLGILGILSLLGALALVVLDWLGWT